MDTDVTAVMDRYLNEVWRLGHIAMLEELCAPTFVVHVLPPPPDPPADVAYLRQLVQIMHSAFTDVKVDVLQQSEMGDMVATELMFSGRHDGYFVGNPPTGKQVRVPCTMFYKVAEGQLVEGWVTWDARGLAWQLGVDLPMFGIHDIVPNS